MAMMFFLFLKVLQMFLGKGKCASLGASSSKKFIMMTY